VNRAIAEEIDTAEMPAFCIGDVAVRNRVLLAPMTGITDAPFRRSVSELGAGLVVSEMTASELLVEGDRNAVLRAEGQGIGIHVVQLAGCEARWPRGIGSGVSVRSGGGGGQSVQTERESWWRWWCRGPSTSLVLRERRTSCAQDDRVREGPKPGQDDRGTQNLLRSR